MESMGFAGEDDFEQRLEKGESIDVSTLALENINTCAQRCDDPSVGRLVTDYFLHTFGRGWVEELARWCGEQEVPLSVILNLVADATWKARSQGLSALDAVALRDLSDAPTSHQEFVPVYAYLQAARFDFNYRQITRTLELLDIDTAPYKAVAEAFKVYAELAAGEDVDPQLITQLAKENPHEKVQHLLLQGMWLTPNSKYGAEIVELGTRLIRQNPGDFNAWMRRAEGHRRLGQFPAAIEAIDTAIANLPTSMYEIHSDYTRERANIVTEIGLKEAFDAELLDVKREITEQGEQQIAKLEEHIEDHTQNLEKQYRDMLFRIMEILGLFVALIALLAVVVGSSMAGNLSVAGRIAVLSTGSIFTCFFFVMIHVLAKPKVPRSHRSRKDG